MMYCIRRNILVLRGKTKLTSSVVGVESVLPAVSNRAVTTNTLVTPNLRVAHQRLSSSVAAKNSISKSLSAAPLVKYRFYSSSSPEQSNSEELETNPLEDYEGEVHGLDLTDEQIQELSGGDPEVVKRIKYMQLEYAVFREEGGQVPLRPIKMKQWSELLQLDSKSKRRKYLLFLFKIEMKQLSHQRKKEERRVKRLEKFAENPWPTREEDEYGMTYGLTRNTLFLRLYDTTVNKYYNGRACSAILHHPPLILDCSYDEFMTPREAKNCAKQLEYVLADNRIHKEPFNIHLCNASRDSKTMKYLRTMIPVLDEDSFIVNIHEGCFTELFPKKNLVYLTPHTRDDLEEYNEDDIYIIGAMVDKSSPRPYSLAKAKKLNLKMKRLPLDTHLMWGLGGKSLTLNQMAKIMLDVRYTRGDWKEALKNVPTRKLCRDFHPNPNQVGYNDTGETGDDHGERPEVSQHRKERKSAVLTDYELLNRRKGYRRSDMFTPRRDDDNRVRPPRMKSLLYDDNE